MSSKKDYNSVDWTKYFYVDHTSESGLRWAVFNRAIKEDSKRFNGDVAGFRKASRDKTSSYYRVKLNGQNYAVHRIIWTVMKGPIPEGYVVNHIDNNIFNNNIDNLEVCLQKVNMRRRKDHTGASLSIANSSGYTGVSLDLKWNKDKTKNVLYVKAFASLLDGRVTSKCFRVDVHGLEGARRLAVEWRDAKLDELNKLGAGYSTSKDVSYEDELEAYQAVLKRLEETKK